MSKRNYYLVFAICYLGFGAGAQSPARLNDVRVEVFGDRVEVRLIGEGTLTHETFWLSRPGAELFVIDLPGVMHAAATNVDLSGDRTDTPWRGWPVRNVKSAQLSQDDPVTRVTIQLSPISGGVRPDVRIAEGVSELVVTIARVGRLAQVPSAVESISGDPNFPSRRISLRFSKAQLQDVLQTLADQARMNLVVDPNVTGEVTVRLEDVTLAEALSALLKGSGYGWLIEGDLLRIVPDKFTPSTRLVIPVGEARGDEMLTLLRTYASQPTLLVYDPQSHTIVYTASQPGEAQMLKALAEELTRRESERALEGDGRAYISTVPLLYAEPADVVALMNTMLAGDNIVATADVRSHAVLLRAPNRSTLTRAINFIQTVDKPTRQVLLKVRIVESTVNASEIIGVDWSASLSFTMSPVSQPSRFPLRPDEPLSGPVSTGTLSTSGLSAVMNFLNTNGNSVLLSSPEVMVLDRQDAEIIVGSREPVRTTTTSNGVVSENVTFIDVGIVLRVSPIVLPGDRVVLAVHPENSSASRSEINGVPRISTSEATTRIIVDNGRTAVIGGLYSQTATEADRKIPFLGSIPFIGKIFRSENNSVQRRNLMVFITPFIIGEGASHPSMIDGDPDGSEIGEWLQDSRRSDAEWHRRIRAGQQTPDSWDERRAAEHRNAGSARDTDVVGGTPEGPDRRRLLPLMRR